MKICCRERRWLQKRAARVSSANHLSNCLVGRCYVRLGTPSIARCGWGAKQSDVRSRITQLPLSR